MRWELQQWPHGALLPMQVPQAEGAAARPRYVQTRAGVWSGLKALTELMRPAPLACMLRHFPGLLAAARGCIAAGQDGAWAAVACLGRMWEVLGCEASHCGPW